MKKFQHYILTRFNLGLYHNQRQDKYQQPVNNDIWMKERLILFENFCFPSMVGQVNQDFKWLVLFDANTPKKYYRQIRKYERYPNFIPLFSHGSFAKGTQKQVQGFTDFCAYIQANLALETTHLITTRLDNDDAFHRQATRLIQSHCQPIKSNRMALDFPIGYCLHKDQLFITRQKNNPFLSLVEKIQATAEERSFLTVMRVKHPSIKRIAPVKHVVTHPLWLQVIHQRNLMNRTRGIPVPWYITPNDFAIHFFQSANASKKQS